MQMLGRDIKRFKAMGVALLAVSYDDSKTQHRFAVHCAAPFPFLSDDGGKVATRYHSAGGFGPIHFAERRTFVIDCSGTIRAIYDGMPNDARLLGDLRRIDDPTSSL